MIPQRLSAKLIIDNPAVVDLPSVIPIFHRWIQQNSAEGLLIDVADYKHVHQGPGVVLIGYEGDYAVDMRDGRPGVQYTRKRDWADDSVADAGLRFRRRVRTVLRLAHQAGNTLQTEQLPAGRLDVRGNEIELRLLDQLQTPNTVETYEAVRADVEAVLAEFYPGKAFTLQQATTDRRLPLTIQTTVAQIA